jgi:hypothetical protein
MTEKLLTTDGFINLALGVLLLWYPSSLASALGLPAAGRPFFASVLGGVLIGVGVALLIERWRSRLRIVGLGLGGAIAINLCAGIVLAAWLVIGRLPLTILGQVVLWTLVLTLVGLSIAELYGLVRRDSC